MDTVTPPPPLPPWSYMYLVFGRHSLTVVILLSVSTSILPLSLFIVCGIVFFLFLFPHFYFILHVALSIIVVLSFSCFKPIATLPCWLSVPLSLGFICNVRSLNLSLGSCFHYYYLKMRFLFISDLPLTGFFASFHSFLLLSLAPWNRKLFLFLASSPFPFLSLWFISRLRKQNPQYLKKIILN